MAKTRDEVTGYTLTRAWFNFSFENPDLISPTHTAMYLWFVELNNRMGWSKKFAAPASYTMSAIGLKSYNTYKKIFDDLVKFGVVKLIKPSRNQYTSCIIAISNFDKALDKALDKAVIELLTTHSESTEQSNDSIIKPETHNLKPLTIVYTAPQWFEVLNFFTEKKYSEPEAKKVFDYYERLKNNKGEWTDKNGNVVESWQGKIISVWMNGEPIIKIKNKKLNATSRTIQPETKSYGGLRTSRSQNSNNNR